MKAGPHCPAKRGSTGTVLAHRSTDQARTRRNWLSFIGIIPHDRGTIRISASAIVVPVAGHLAETPSIADTNKAPRHLRASPEPPCSYLPGERAAGDDRALAGACELWHDQPHTRRPHPGRATAEIDHGATAAPAPRRRRATGAPGRLERRSACRPLCCGGSKHALHLPRRTTSC